MMSKIQKIDRDLPSGEWADPKDGHKIVKVGVLTSSYSGEEHDCEGEWCCRPDTYTTFEGLTTEGYVSSFPVRAESEDGVYYAVVVDYNTGDTFGQDSGCISIVGVEPTQELADGLRKAAESYSSEKFNYRFEYEGWQYHANWLGYFESLNHVQVVSFKAATA